MGSVFKKTIVGRAINSLTPSYDQIQTPPPPQILDFIDEIAGIEQVTVTGPDGKKQIVRRQLPLSPEEQKLLDTYKAIEQETIDVMNKLSSQDLAINIEEFQPAIQAYRETGEAQIEDAIKYSTRTQEEALARRGLSDSTAGAEQRAFLGGQEREARQQLGRDTTLFAENLRSDALNRQLGLFQLATGQQSLGFTEGLQAAQQGLNAQNLALGAQQNYNNLVTNIAMQNQSNAIAAQNSRNQVLAAIGGAAGRIFGPRLFGGTRD